jgi:hypothetical protein
VLQLARGGPAPPTENIEVDTLFHMLLLVQPSAVTRCFRQTVRINKSNSGIAQFQSDIGQYTLAIFAQLSVDVHRQSPSGQSPSRWSGCR